MKMKTCWMAVASCITMSMMLAHAQSADEGYQMARVVSIERVAANAQHMEGTDNYKISMRMGETLYACHASGPAAMFIDWAPNKEFPAKLNGKVLLVKSPNGQIAELNIVKKTPK